MSDKPSARIARPPKNRFKVSRIAHTLLRTPLRIMMMSLGAGLLIWVIDTLLDYFAFYRGQSSFLQLLLTAPPPHEVYIRLVIVAFFLAFGWLVSLLINRQKEIEHHLSIEEAELRATLYSIGDAVIATDKNGIVVRMNPVAEQLTGWTEAEGIGQPLETVFHIIHEETRREVESPTIQVLREGVIVGLANHTMLIARDGRESPIADAGAPIFDAQKNIQGVVLVFRDQTEERFSQLLMENRLLLIEYAASHPTGDFQKFCLDTIKNIVDSRFGLFRMLQESEENPLDKRFSTKTLDYVFSTDDNEIQAYPETSPALTKCIQTQKPVVSESEDSANGITRELLVPVIRDEKVVAVYGVGNKPFAYTEKDVEIVSYFVDISWELLQKEISQERLNISEDNYRSLFHNILNGFALHEIVLDEHGKPIDYIFLELNKAFESLTTLKREDIIGRRVTEVIPGIENDPAGWIERYGEVAIGGKDLFFEQFSQDLGKWYSVLAYSPKPGFFATIFQDVTEQKVSAEALKESQRQLSTLMNNLPGMVYRCRNDRDWTMEFVSDGCMKLTGYPSSDLVNNKKLSFNEIMHPDDQQMVWNTVQEGLKQHRSYQIIYRIITADGELKWVWEQGQGVLGPNNEFVALEGFVTDITEQKVAEDSLRYQAMLMENVTDAVITADMELNILSWNKTAEEMLGWKEEEVLGQNIQAVILTEYPDTTYVDVTREFQENGLWKGEAILTRKDGSQLYVLTTISRVLDEFGNPHGYISINKDISEIKEHETTLNAQREKLSALAQQVLTTQENERMILSRDLHDTLGQALAVHKIYLNLLEQKIKREAPELVPDLDKVKNSVEMAAQISRSLSHSLRPPDLDALGLKVALRNLCNQTAEVSGKHLEFETNLEDDFHSEVDITLYRVGQEALNNVLKHSEATRITLSCMVEGNQLLLTVTDDGIGFNPEILDSHQSGLGIIGMNERMEYIGGSLEIGSSPNEGTTITARYPLKDDKLAGHRK